MDNFKTIYKILRQLDKHKGDEAFDLAEISAERLKVSFAEWEQLIIELAGNDYIRGVVYTQAAADKFPHICEPMRHRVTIKP